MKIILTNTTNFNLWLSPPFNISRNIFAMRIALATKLYDNVLSSFFRVKSYYRCGTVKSLTARLYCHTLAKESKSQKLHFLVKEQNVSVISTDVNGIS